MKEATARTFLAELAWSTASTLIFVAVLFLFGLTIVPRSANAQLLPYGEVELLEVDGRSTFFSLLNASDGPVIAGISIFDTAGGHHLTLRRRIAPGAMITQNAAHWFSAPLVVCTNTEGTLVAPPGSLGSLIASGTAQFFLTFSAFMPTADDCLLEGPPVILPDGTLRGDMFFVDGNEDSGLGAPLVTSEHAGRWSVRFNAGGGSFDGSFLVFHSATGAPVVVSAVNEAGIPITLQEVFLSGVEAVLGVAALIDVADKLEPGSPFGRIILDCAEPCSVSALWFAQGRYSATVPGHYLGPVP